jgi:glycosyltransferase involved in cell wall biosynthesis
MPVAMQENTFMPSRLSATKIAHLDRWQDFATTRQGAAASGVWPKKIWPTCAQPRIWPNSNQLELLGEPARAKALLREDLVVIAVVRNEMVLLPHFLAHYRRLGVNCFVFVDNCSDDGTREYLASQPDAVVYSVDTEYKRSHYGVSWQLAVMGNLCLGKWVLLADADEFLVYEDCETVPLAELTGSIDREGRDGALLYMIDMYPYADLGEADFEKGEPFTLAPHFDKDPLIELRFGGGSYSNSRNFVNRLRHRIAPSRINAYVSQKYALFRYRPWVRLSEGVHYSANIAVSAKPFFFAHFKYHAGFKRKVLTEVSRNQHFNGAEEYRRYIAMLAEGMGGFGAEAFTTRYRGSRSFVELVERR